jgi:hypothetical protein
MSDALRRSNVLEKNEQGDDGVDELSAVGSVFDALAPNVMRDRLFRQLDARLREHLWRRKRNIDSGEVDEIVKTAWALANSMKWSDEQVEEWAVKQAEVMEREAPEKARAALDKWRAALVEIRWPGEANEETMNDPNDPNTAPATVAPPESKWFRSRYRDMSELLREWELLRTHNLTFKEGDPQDKYLIFAEGLVAIVALERFVRAVVGSDATDRDTLDALLRKATAGKTPLLRLPWEDQDEGRKRICAVRNMILHGNFEQAAREEGLASKEEFFKKKFAGTVEGMGKILENLLDQIDVRTGRPTRGPGGTADG